ncbi:efflux RND transporter periplasmic adaptor subunit [Hydrogenimonas sp.]
MKKVVITLVVLLLAAGGIYFAKSKKEEVAHLPPPASKRVAVETVRPRTMKIEQTRSFLGRYVSREHPFVASKISGFIREVPVREGAQVRRGDLLVRIDDSEPKAAVAAQKASIRALESALAALESSIDSLEADYRYAKEVYERNRALYEAGALAREKLDLSEVAMKLKASKLESTRKSLAAKRAEIDAAKAQLRSKESLLAYARIRSPIDGRVAKVMLRTGDLAVPGKPILQLVGEAKRVDFTLPPDETRIAAGTPVRIRGIAANVSAILPAADRGLAVARVEPLKDLGIPENGNVEVTVRIASAEGSAVPVDALLHRKDGTYLFSYENGAFHPRKVQVVADDGRYAVVAESLNHPVARGSDDKLSRLFVLKEVEAIGDE